MAQEAQVFASNPNDLSSKQGQVDWKDGSGIKEADFSSRGSRFSSQCAHDHPQLSVTSVSGYSVLPPGLYGHQAHTQNTDTHADKTFIYINTNRDLPFPA